MAFEKQLEQGLRRGIPERSFIDKVLAKEDVNAIRELIKKPKLTRVDLLEIMYLISATEAKLVNYSEWDRYVILKFFVWIREFVKIAEILYDYHDNLDKSELKLSKRAKRLLDNNTMLIQHNIKFLVDLYLNISRTSMSIGAAGFRELLTNKYEVIYPQTPTTLQVEQKSGLFGVRGAK